MRRLSGGPEAVYEQRYPFMLPALGYPPKAVEPALDAKLLARHHDVLHAASVASLNAALAVEHPLQEYTLGELLMGLRKWPTAVRALIREHGGSHANHALWWNLLAPGAEASRSPQGRLGEMITRDFGSTEACLAALSTASLGQVGNGWTWLVKTATSRVAVRVLAHEDSPLLEGELPLVGIDGWAHAWRADAPAKDPAKDKVMQAAYVAAVLARVNWDVAGAQLGV